MGISRKRELNRFKEALKLGVEYLLPRERIEEEELML